MEAIGVEKKKKFSQYVEKVYKKLDKEKELRE